MNGLEIAKNLVSEAVCKKLGDISEELRLFHDLGIDGDDAEELLIKVRDDYNVNLDSFNFSDHFGSEIGAGWRHIIHHWFLRYGKMVYEFRPITVGMLAKAIDSGVME